MITRIATIRYSVHLSFWKLVWATYLFFCQFYCTLHAYTKRLYIGNVCAWVRGRQVLCLTDDFVLIRNIFIFCNDLSFLSIQCINLIEVQRNLLVAFNYAAQKCFEMDGPFVILICMMKNRAQRRVKAQIQREKAGNTLNTN